MGSFWNRGVLVRLPGASVAGRANMEWALSSAILVLELLLVAGSSSCSGELKEELRRVVRESGRTSCIYQSYKQQQLQCWAVAARFFCCKDGFLLLGETLSSIMTTFHAKQVMIFDLFPEAGRCSMDQVAPSIRQLV